MDFFPEILTQVRYTLQPDAYIENLYSKIYHDNLFYALNYSTNPK